MLQAWVACEATVEFWGCCSSHTYAAGRQGVSLHQGCYAQRTGSPGAMDPAAWWRTSNFDEQIRKQNLPGANRDRYRTAVVMCSAHPLLPVIYTSTLIHADP